MNNKTCGKCRFYDNGVQPGGLAFCRQRPPDRSGWPVVRTEDWCGAYCPKPQGDAANLEAIVSAYEAGEGGDLIAVHAALRHAQADGRISASEMAVFGVRVRGAAVRHMTSNLEEISQRVDAQVDEGLRAELDELAADLELFSSTAGGT